MHTETIYRYRILKHEELPESHKEALRQRGINPDTRWSLVYSFEKLNDAIFTLEECNYTKADYETYKLKDAGATEYREVADDF